MKLYTEEQVMDAIKYGQNYEKMDKGEIPYVTDDEFINSLTSIELPSDEEIYLMSEKYAEKCGLRNFFDEDEVTIMKHHWVMGYESAIKDFLDIQAFEGNNEQQ